MGPACNGQRLIADAVRSCGNRYTGLIADAIRSYD
jgi:hypothetical protein